MRHFVATILIAFLIMVGNQMEYETHPKDAQPELCMFLGKFSFSFRFMSEKLLTNEFIRYYSLKTFIDSLKLSDEAIINYKYQFRFISIVNISGFAAQYFFLAAFTLMCAMSCEVWLQLRYGKNEFKKVIQMLLFSFFVFSEAMQPMKSVTVLKFGLAMFFRSYFLSLLVLWKPSDLDAHQ